VIATRDWGDLEKARVLVIGHDPRLQKSPTIADYCFFADYYFKPVPSEPRETKKYSLAKSVFDCVRDITSECYRDEEVYITNLCNEALPSALPNHTVFISREKAEEGLGHIREVLSKAKIEFIFPMSTQVNYWLQELGFYSSGDNFVERAKPSPHGIKNDQPYYEVSSQWNILSISTEL
jgi:hypothetical protein